MLNIHCCCVCCRYGKIQCVTPINDDGGTAAGARSVVVAFMDIKSAEKAHSTENNLDGTHLQTQYSETRTGTSHKKGSRSAAAAAARGGEGWVVLRLLSLLSYNIDDKLCLNPKTFTLLPPISNLLLFSVFFHYFFKRLFFVWFLSFYHCVWVCVWLNVHIPNGVLLWIQQQLRGVHRLQRKLEYTAKDITHTTEAGLLRGTLVSWML